MAKNNKKFVTFNARGIRFNNSDWLETTINISQIRSITQLYETKWKKVKKEVPTGNLFFGPKFKEIELEKTDGEVIINQTLITFNNGDKMILKCYEKDLLNLIEQC